MSSRLRIRLVLELAEGGRLLGAGGHDELEARLEEALKCRGGPPMSREDVEAFSQRVTHAILGELMEDYVRLVELLEKRGHLVLTAELDGQELQRRKGRSR